MDFVDANRGWIGAEGGLILATVDGGNTWTVQQPAVGSEPAIRTINCLDATHCWAGASPDVIYRYDGVAWTLHTIVPASVTGVKFVDPVRGWAVGVGGNAFKTTDGGLNWTHTHDFGGTGLQIASNRTAVDFVNDRQGWTVGLRYINGPGAVMSTVDGGVTWQDTSPPTSVNMSSAQGVDFLDAVHGWAVGGGGRIFRYGPIP